jgi:hypothetical protein
VVELGTDRHQELPWLTALDRPVQVLHVTAVAFGADGRSVRIGEEGLVARRTPIVLSGFGVDALVREEEVAALLEEAGGPSGWSAALEALLDGLVP